ncbi:MAG: peptide chain release factor N(5)-glutamine methyltransferase [Methylococcales bacterium]
MSSQINTVEQLLSTAIPQLNKTSLTAQLDAEILLAFALNKSRTWLRTWPEQRVDQSVSNHFNQLIEQRHQGLPIAYLTGQREFWTHTFQVSKDVLIPRPETELLVEHCLQMIVPNQSQLILELGTGSGAIAVSIATERPKAQVIATDVSQAALEMARINADSAGVSNIQFLQSDWFNTIDTQGFAIIISNPPYIEQNDPHLQQGDVRFEPRLALTSGKDGLRDIQIIAQQAQNHLATNAYLALEHGYNQSHTVAQILSNNHYTNIKNYCDLQGNPRITIAQYIH